MACLLLADEPVRAESTLMPSLPYAKEIPTRTKKVFLHLSGYAHLIGKARLHEHVLTSINDVCNDADLVCTTLETLYRNRSKSLHRYLYYSFWEQFFDMMIERQVIGLEVEISQKQLIYLRDWMRLEREYNFIILVEKASTEDPKRSKYPTTNPMIFVQTGRHDPRFCNGVTAVGHVCLPPSFTQPFENLADDFELQPAN